MLQNRHVFFALKLKQRKTIIISPSTKSDLILIIHPCENYRKVLHERYQKIKRNCLCFQRTFQSAGDLSLTD